MVIWLNVEGKRMFRKAFKANEPNEVADASGLG